MLERLVLLGGLALLGCGGGDPGTAPGPAPCQGRGDSYRAGLEKRTPAGVVVRLVEAVPAPPARFANDWTMSFQPPPGVTSAEPFMPDHGHGSPAVTGEPVEGAPGTFRFSGLSLFMPGYWEVTVSVLDGPAPDAAVFAFCVEG